MLISRGDFDFKRNPNSRPRLLAAYTPTIAVVGWLVAVTSMLVGGVGDEKRVLGNHRKVFWWNWIVGLLL